MGNACIIISCSSRPSAQLTPNADIASFNAGVGFLFVIYTVLFELVMGIPGFRGKNVLLGGSPVNKAASVH